MVFFFGFGPSFVNLGVRSSGRHLDLKLGGGIVTVVSVHPAQRRTSPLGVVPVGLGEGVGDCHDAAYLQRRGLFFNSLLTCSREENFTLFLRVWFLIFVHC